MNDRRPRILAALFAAIALASPSSHALTLDGGLDNTFAINASQHVWAWGGNVGGKLGNGATVNSSMPVRVEIPAIVAVSGGASFTCAVTASGGAKCWGSNFNGELGDGTTTQRLLPVTVSGLSTGVAAVSAGTYSACALTSAGGVKCWGANWWGQLGNGTTTDSHTPVDVSGLTSGAAAVGLGIYHACALTSAGGVKCWGTNNLGQVGDGTATNRHSPVDVYNLTGGVTGLAVGQDHSCALMGTGLVKCWGANGRGQLGNGSTTYSNVPVDVYWPATRPRLVAIAAGAYHTCAIDTNADIWCWGYNVNGQLGDNSLTDRSAPVKLSDLDVAGVAASISAGDFHTCAITTAGAAKCWGANTYGQLGDNSTIQRQAPVAVSGLASGVLHIDLGSSHSCALIAGGGLECWGLNSFGQLGDNTTTNRQTSVPVDPSQPIRVPLTGITAVAAGMSHTLALKSDGSVWAWGLNPHGQLGAGENAAPESCAVEVVSGVFVDQNCSTVPMRVPGLSGVTAIGTGWGHSIALTGDGTVVAWGNNDDGQATGGLTGVTKIAAGYFHNLALKSDGTVVAWGRGTDGQLGDGLSASSSSPVAVSGLTGVVDISAKGSHSVALKSDGTVWAWGLNAYGEVGNGTTTDVSTPVQVGSFNNVVEISAGMSTTMIRTADGAAYAWGLNTSGQLGVASGDSCGGHACAMTPRQLPTSTTYRKVAAAGAHGMAVRADGTLLLFGDNSSGQLANRSGTFGTKFTQSHFDPLFQMTPAPAAGSGTSVGASSSGVGISVDTLGASLDFGPQLVGATPAAIPVVLKNLDSVPVKLFSIEVAGSAFSRTHDCPASLPSNESCTMNISFAPSATGYADGLLEILSDAVDSAVMTYTIAGRGVTVPGAPTIGTATAGNQQATVSFSPPASDGGSPITSYTATSSPGNLTATGTSSPITVTGLANGTTYTFVVQASNAYGMGPPSASSNGVTPVQPPALVSVKSRKTHAGAGTFDITVDASQVPSGAVTADSRAIASGHKIVFTFDTTITSAGTVTTSNGSVASTVVSGNDVEVTLAAVPDNTRATISMTGVNGTAASASATVGFLVGDTDSSRSVDGTDITAIKAQSGATVGAANFRCDVDLSGAVTSSDILRAKGRVGLPAL